MADKKKHETVKWLLPYVIQQKRRILLSLIASLGVAATDVSYAKLVEPLVDRILVSGNEKMMLWVPAFVVALALLKGVARFLQEYFIQSSGQLIVRQLRDDLFAKTMTLSLAFFNRMNSGQLMSINLNDISRIQKSTAQVLIDSVKESCTMIGLVGLALYQDWRLALVALAVLPLALVPASLIGKKIKDYSRRGQNTMGSLTMALEQAYSGIKLIKAFATENRENLRFNAVNGQYYNYMRKLIKYNAISSPIIEILASLGVSGVLWYGMHRVLSGAITQGELFSTMVAIVMLYMPAKRLIKVNNNIQLALGAAERVMEVIKEKPGIIDAARPVEVSGLRGEIEFERVAFAYDNELVLDDFSLRIEPGEVVALVGASGAGKTTVAALLNRFYDPAAGRIKIDGVDIRDFSLDFLRSNLALVDQETFLFNDTVAKNLSYGLNQVTAAEISTALQRAYADDFVEQLPEKLATMIGDRGVRLSGGQRQRLCIARALLRQAPILILDEATSALDSESEQQVQKALLNLMQDRTTLVIAHRLSTIMRADKIIVMEAGRIVESGRHEELIQVEGVYQKLYKMQLAER